jgi:hypothetical protein
MLEIKLCTDRKQITARLKKLGKPFSEAFYMYTAANRGEPLAACLFEVESEAVRACYYDCADAGDYWLFDGMLRAGFNFASEQGILYGRIPEEFRALHEDLFSRLNYPAEPEFDITNFFKKYKNCR